MTRISVVVLFFAAVSFAHAGVVGDIDGDGKVGLPEAIYSLQSLAGLRTPLAVAGQVKVISKYVELDTTTTTATLWTVPAGRSIVITDILILGGINVYLYENTLLKIRVYKDFNNGEYHFNSGVAFSSGSEISLQSPGVYFKDIFISGYEVDQ